MENFELEAMIRGYHEYQTVWSPVQGELLDCRREPGNRHDPYAVAVIRSSMLVGHVPRCISSLRSAFIRRGGTITCQVTDARRRYLSDLPQGGLGVPCILQFFG